MGCCSNVNGSLDGCLTEELKRVNLPQEGSIVDDSKVDPQTASVQANHSMVWWFCQL